MRFALFGNTHEIKKSAHLAHLFEILSKYNDEIFVGNDFLQDIQKESQFSTIPLNLLGNLSLQKIDIAISLGGDGTFLKAAHTIGDSNVPIVGINTGRLGFLADVSSDEMDIFFKELHEKRYSVRKRSLLELIINDDEQHPQYALNEIGILKHDSASMIAVHTMIDNEHLATYMGDGLLIATPTGSTAYSLSAGGPIIYPISDVILLTAVAPHSLNVRPIVISDDKTIHLKIESRNGSFLVAVDGHSHSYPENTTLTLRKAPFHIRVIKREGSSFFQTLQKKMKWGADPRE